MRQPVQQLIQLYQNNLFTAAFNICQNQMDAEDAVQETFVQYYTSRKEFENEQHIRAWLLRVVINKAKNINRTFWKNTETGRYYCVLSEDMSQKLRKECLCYANNDVKTEHAALIVTTFVHNRAGFQTDGTPDNEIGNGWGCYDLGLQNENLILKATELGLSTLIMGLRDGDKIREMLSIPESETIVSVIAVGKADEEPSRPRRRELEDVLKFF